MRAYCSQAAALSSITAKALVHAARVGQRIIERGWGAEQEISSGPHISPTKNSGISPFKILSQNAQCTVHSAYPSWISMFSSFCAPESCGAEPWLMSTPFVDSIMALTRAVLPRSAAFCSAREALPSPYLMCGIAIDTTTQHRVRQHRLHVVLPRPTLLHVQFAGCVGVVVRRWGARWTEDYLSEPPDGLASLDTRVRIQKQACRIVCCPRASPTNRLPKQTVVRTHLGQAMP